MESSSIAYSGGVFAGITARSFAILRKLFRREPRLSLAVETIIADACHRIDQQDAQLVAAAVEDGKKAAEIRLLQYELEWMQAVVREAKCTRCRKPAGIVLSDYDYLHVRGSASVRRRRAKAAAGCRRERKGH